VKRSQNALWTFCMCLGTVQVLTAEQKPHIAEQKHRRIVSSAGPIVPLLATVGTVSASPATITFTATDPDLGSVSGSGASTVSWTTSSTGSCRFIYGLRHGSDVCRDCDLRQRDRRKLRRLQTCHHAVNHGPASGDWQRVYQHERAVFRKS
jgi:hypothetical protein